MAEVFDRYGRAVYSVALRILKDTGHAEDVMQEIFFQIWRNSDSFVQGRGSLGAWLVVVAAPAVAALRPIPRLSPVAASTPIPTTYRFFVIALPSLHEPHSAGSALLSRAKLGGPSERAGGVEFSSMAR